MFWLQVKPMSETVPTTPFSGVTEPEHETGNAVAGSADERAFFLDFFFAFASGEVTQFLYAFMFTFTGAWRYSPTVVDSPPPPPVPGARNEVTSGSPPTKTKSLTGFLPHALAPSLIPWVMRVPAATCWKHGPVTTAFLLGIPRVESPSIRLNP